MKVHIIYLFAIVLSIISHAHGQNSGAVGFSSSTGQMATPVAINGVMFDGTAGISVPMMAPTINSTPARALSTTGSDNTFTISSTKVAVVHYTVNIAYALTLGTSNGAVTLDYSINGGTTWVTIDGISNVYSTSITLSGNNNYLIGGFIPANALVRIMRVSNSNVTITMPTDKQQEIIFQ